MFEVRLTDVAIKSLDELAPGEVMSLHVSRTASEFAIMHKDDLEYIFSLLKLKMKRQRKRLVMKQ